MLRCHTHRSRPGIRIWAPLLVLQPWYVSCWGLGTLSVHPAGFNREKPQDWPFCLIFFSRMLVDRSELST